MAQVEEPLLESAPIAWEYAARSCGTDPGTGIGCRPYHAIWQYLRLMGVVTTPAQHAGFYLDAFDAVARRTPRPGVLISGAADYCMLAHAIAGCRRGGGEPEATMGDLCETPLRLGRWYAERASCSIVTRRGDILSLHEDCRFDVICTDSILSRYAPPQRLALVAHWRRLLKPGGQVVTVNRIRAPDRPRLPESEQAVLLRRTVLERAPFLPAAAGIDPEALAQTAADYARSRRVHPVVSLEEVADLFAQTGYVLDHLGAAAAASDRQPWSAEARGATYAQVIARNP